MATWYYIRVWLRRELHVRCFACAIIGKGARGPSTGASLLMENIEYALRPTPLVEYTVFATAWLAGEHVRCYTLACYLHPVPASSILLQKVSPSLSLSLSLSLSTIFLL